MQLEEEVTPLSEEGIRQSVCLKSRIETVPNLDKTGIVHDLEDAGISNRTTHSFEFLEGLEFGFKGHRAREGGLHQRLRIIDPIGLLGGDETFRLQLVLRLKLLRDLNAQATGLGNEGDDDRPGNVCLMPGRINAM